MILEQKEVFRIGSNPAFDPLVWNYTQRKICMFYILRKQKNVEGEQWTTDVLFDDIVLSVEMTHFQPKAKG